MGKNSGRSLRSLLEFTKGVLGAGGGVEGRGARVEEHAAQPFFSQLQLLSFLRNVFFFSLRQGGN